MRIKTAPDALSWYRSKIIVGAIIALISLIAKQFGLAEALAPADQAELVDLIVTIAGAIGGATAVGARLAQKHAPSIKGR